MVNTVVTIDGQDFIVSHPAWWSKRQVEEWIPSVVQDPQVIECQEIGAGILAENDLPDLAYDEGGQAPLTLQVLIKGKRVPHGQDEHQADRQRVLAVLMGKLLPPAEMLRTELRQAWLQGWQQGVDIALALQYYLFLPHRTVEREAQAITALLFTWGQGEISRDELSSCLARLLEQLDETSPVGPPC